MENKKINFTKMEYKLVSVLCDINRIEEIKVNLDVHDELTFESIDDSKLNLLLTRELTFDDEKTLGLKVTHRIIASIDEDAKKHFNNSNEKIIKFIAKNKENIANDIKAGSESSLIIGQITSALKFGPIVLPPYFIDKQRNQK